MLLISLVEIRYLFQLVQHKPLLIPLLNIHVGHTKKFLLLGGQLVRQDGAHMLAEARWLFHLQFLLSLVV